MIASSDNYILFELAGGVYGIPSSDVLHIDLFDQAALVPNAHPALEGLILSRGQLVPALSLRARFGFPKIPPTVRTRVILVRFQQRIVGLVADSAREFRPIPPELIRPIEETLAGAAGKHVRAAAQLGPRLILLLNLAAILDLQDSPAPPVPQVQIQRTDESQAPPLPPSPNTAPNQTAASHP